MSAVGLDDINSLHFAVISTLYLALCGWSMPPQASPKMSHACNEMSFAKTGRKSWLGQITWDRDPRVRSALLLGLA